MQERNPSIFRQNAVQHYLHDREESVLPRFVSPRTFLYLWLLLALLLAGGLVSWFAQVPIFVSGPAFVVERTAESQPDSVAVAILLPPETLSSLYVDQPLFVQLTEGTRLQRSIVTIDHKVNSPQRIREELGLPAELATTIRQPATVAFADLAPLPSDLPASAYAGSVYRVEVQVGSRRVISLLPFIGQFFQG